MFLYLFFSVHKLYISQFLNSVILLFCYSVFLAIDTFVTSHKKQILHFFNSRFLFIFNYTTQAIAINLWSGHLHKDC